MSFIDHIKTFFNVFLTLSEDLEGSFQFHIHPFDSFIPKFLCFFPPFSCASLVSLSTLPPFLFLLFFSKFLCKNSCLLQLLLLSFINTHQPSSFLHYPSILFLSPCLKLTGKLIRCKCCCIFPFFFSVLENGFIFMLNFDF